ncbi:hypothetical protein D3C71_886870 [compost metagenome]
MRPGRVVADQFLERFVRHLHLKRRTGIDETGYDTLHFGNDETLGPGGDAGGDFLAGRRFVTFVGNGFDGVAAVKVSRRDIADEGVHGSSESAGERQGIINQPACDIERRIGRSASRCLDHALIGSQISSLPVLSFGLKSSL